MDPCNYSWVTSHHILIKNPTFLRQTLTKKVRCIYGYTNSVKQNVLITWVQKKSWKIFLSKFPRALEINPCTRTVICNTYELINVSGDVLNAGGNVEDEDDYGFIGSFFKKAPIIVDDNTKLQLMKMNRNPKLNIYKQ